MSTARIPLLKNAEYTPRTIPDKGQCHFIGEDNQYCSKHISRDQTYCTEHYDVIYVKKRTE